MSRRTQFVMTFLSAFVLCASAVTLLGRAASEQREQVSRPAISSPTPSASAMPDPTVIPNTPIPDPTFSAPPPAQAPESQFAIRHIKQIDYGGAKRDLLSGGSDVEFVSFGGRDFAVAGLLLAPAKIIDITDPQQPFVVGEIPCALFQNDVQITQVGGQQLALLSSDTPRGNCLMTNTDGTTFTRSNPIGFAVADISNPANPRVISFVEIPEGAHNVTIHPSQPIVYVSNADRDSGRGAIIHIYDISQPSQPSLIRNWIYSPGYSPHDITFNEKSFAQQVGGGAATVEVGSRAYAASIDHSDIIDTADPRNPRLISTINHPNISISHQSDPTPNGQFLLIADELGGGQSSTRCPGGGIHVYRIGPNRADEERPRQVGVFFVNKFYKPEGRSYVCTPHVFRINPDGKSLAGGWYGNGVHLIDFSNLLVNDAPGQPIRSGATTLASIRMPESDTWAAKMWCKHPGYIFSNDLGRGFDVFFVDGFAARQGC